MQLVMIKGNAPDMTRIAAWLAEYSNSEVHSLKERLERLWRSAKPLCELFRKERAGSAEKLRQRLEEELPMECANVRPLTSVERGLLLEHKRSSMRSARLRESVAATRLLGEETQTHASQANAGRAHSTH